MSDLRTAAQQALEFLDAEFGWSPGEAPRIDALRAALAQQDEPVLVQGELPPRYVARSPIQAEPVQPVATLTAQRDALLEALKAMLHRDERNTCRHEETHRGGAIWEICDSCGAMWADDEGGKPEWEDPKEWAQARAAIKAAEETK